jgi:hypothetical protein
VPSHEKKLENGYGYAPVPGSTDHHATTQAEYLPDGIPEIGCRANRAKFLNQIKGWKKFWRSHGNPATTQNQ